MGIIHFLKRFTKFIIILLTYILVVSCADDDDDEITEAESIIIKEVYNPDYTLITNPERGIYKHWPFDVNAQPMSVSSLKKYREEKNISLIFTYYVMSAFKDKPLSAAYLNLFQANCDALRQAGSKSVLRFCYENNRGRLPHDAPQEIVLQHISQLKPLLRKNADVISVMEAGFIGIYGEWHDSSNFNHATDGGLDYEKARAVIDALLDALPENRMINIRSPKHKTKVLQIGMSEIITLEEAYKQNKKSRLGHHNDCFLASETDMGTYVHPITERAYVMSDSEFTCMGGETCTVPNTFSECAKAIDGMKKYHWSYLNGSYHPDMIENWKTVGCFEQINARLGYRFILESSEHIQQALPEQKYMLKFSMRNDGFATPYNPRPVEIIFRTKETKEIVFKHQLNTDPRFWKANTTTTIVETFVLPADLKAGTYQVLLFMPDPAPSIAHRAEYAIRLMNKNIWEDTGFHLLYEQLLMSPK